MRGLAGKRVVITGGARGIGRAAVARFLDEGAAVAVIDRNEVELAALRVDEPRIGPTPLADVVDRTAVEDAFARIGREIGTPDVVINNAGISTPHRFLDIEPADWDRVLSVNLTGVFNVAQLAARRMMAAGSGVIINMGSVSGLVGMPRYADYNAAKAAVIELTRTMALELAPAVRVVAVCPGYVMTPMQRSEYTPDEMAAVNARIPLKRHAEPEEIAALFAFLASDEAPFITGAPIIIDGGETAGGMAS